MKSSTPISIVMGATATGKSDYAVRLAQKIDGEIINADAMQLYKEIPIGTAQLSKEEQGSVPHHLLGIISFRERWDVTQYLQHVDEIIAEIQGRKKNVILCGGTGYYIKSLLWGLDPLPGDAELRKSLDAQYDHAEGEAELHARVAKEIPEDYAVYAYNRRKLIRALEVFLLTGKAMSTQFSPPKEMRYSAIQYHITRERACLKERITRRAHLMFEQGWMDEAKAVIGAGILESPTARQAIGYPIIHAHLKGEISYAEMVSQISTKTWQYARRQITWFTHQHPDAKIVCPES